MEETTESDTKTDLQLSDVRGSSHSGFKESPGNMEKTIQHCKEPESDLHGDDASCSSDFKNTCSYSLLQRDVAGVFTSIQQVIKLPEFHDHIIGNPCMDEEKKSEIQLYSRTSETESAIVIIEDHNHTREETFVQKLKDIDKELESRKKDLMKTGCPIVVAGETSAGKSSVINLIIGEDILPTDITATTTRICRLRYSERFQILTCDSNDREIHVDEFDNKEEIKEKLSELATTDNDKIKYIDVLVPIEILKGNVFIVDTPGIGDKTQENIATMMMDYIPNALAFVFVVNMVNAGGLQQDRLPRILKHARESMNEMHSFDPKDAIFLLNKWDTLIIKNRKVDLFDETKMKLQAIWKEADDNNILKFAAARNSTRKMKITAESKTETVRRLDDVMCSSDYKYTKRRS